MGGLASAAEQAGVSRVRLALLDKRKGNALAFHKLQHALARGTAEEITELLIGLTHFSVELSNGARDVDAQSLRELMKSAVEINMQSLSESCKKDSSGAAAAALDAYRLFVLNLVSADVTFVEYALVCFAKKAFLLNFEIREAAMDRVHSIIPSILAMHPQAAGILARIVNERHPHPVRQVVDICAYMRSILEVSLKCESQALRSAIISTTVEKLVTIDALVPSKVEGLDDNDQGMVDVGEVDGCKEEGEIETLSAEAAKMDLALAEVLQFLEKACLHSRKRFVRRHLEPLFRAFERYVLPAQGARFAPYVLFHGATLAGERVAEDLCERLRQSFFDSSLDEETRASYIRFSSAMVSRSRVLSAAYALQWIRSVARWLNHYIDPYDERFLSAPFSDVDTDVHMLFYTAVCALMKAAALRQDAFEPSVCRERDVMARMRLLRIFSSPMNPLLIIPPAIVNQFCTTAMAVGGLDLKDLLNENELRYTPSRTKFGSRNSFTYYECLTPLELPESRGRISQEYRSFESEGTHAANNCTDSADYELDREWPVGSASTKLTTASEVAQMVL